MVKHVAMIMDGNGRWAKAKGFERTKGHKAGAETIRTIALEANRLGIEVLTLYAFSTENWKRPPKEVEYLCKLPKMFFNKYIRELNEKNIKVMHIGELERFPSDTVKVILEAEKQTKDNTGLKLVIAINYGSRREITLAAQAYAKDVIDGKQPLDIDEDTFGSYMMTNGLPEIDLLVRTSGEKRLSNFLMWQLAYAEFVFVDYAWPELDEARFANIIEEFNQRNRRFGGV
ncbi:MULTISPECIES: isoprenyl transferase [unclassified Breznakia]|uniref:isoprenyl transferase n=1 Tax=unclassified Breznakia TaxID=2623764 RepID=UPI002476D3E2|nr:MULTISPECIES: isoprenyl transferase [unclassified Breznakia]MDH6366737.1 undecaprenyl diphosphate synthase [Breznakia sp. PH1-1]MDH6403876.1 undecaprenyl diphosphate synthase [Breznakia sp. PF1-11]MDH6411585.1 undecaprenyl diphosphate synthase [Breznakia sp. PFB1-11]MDH6413949.1 undecaprenyl diphosphate synthase [Breznakia sp. PFB1-14]MDH6416378.1 undecaprenyl diphosphate synthase [Breznakia sp. PFB1-4]